MKNKLNLVAYGLLSLALVVGIFLSVKSVNQTQDTRSSAAGEENPNTKEIDLHKRICSYEFIRDMNFISDSSKWFNKIFTFNLKTQYFSNSPLRIFYFNFFLNILNETKMISPIILAKYYITNPMFRGLYKKKFINYLISNKYEF